MLHLALHTRQLHIVHLHRTDAGSPCIALHVAGHADLLRICLSVEVAAVGLIGVAGHVNHLLVVAVLHILDSEATEQFAITLHTTLCQCRERIHLIWSHIYNLTDFGCRPTCFPHVAVHTQHVVVLIHFVVALLLDDFLCGVVLVPRTHIPTFDVGCDASTAGIIAFAFESRVLNEVLHDVAILHTPFRLQCQVGSA